MDVGCDQWTKAAVRICRRKNSTFGLGFTARDVGVLDRVAYTSALLLMSEQLANASKSRAGTRCG